jgi:GTP-binding protein
MLFLDEAVIRAVSGSGGKGCISFRRERFIPKGGPDGGNGGLGSSIIARATKKLYDLNDYNAKKYFKAGDGRPGRGGNCSGKNADNLVLLVPLGTIIEDFDSQEILADLIDEGQEITIIEGGLGGKGNRHFATSTNRAPRMAQPGMPGQEKRLKLTLKHLADIGLVGLPNAGKSTLLSRLTMARPRIDSYPFSTIVPNLGVMTFSDESTSVVADIPGLIEGASSGRGLGHQFLRHIERTSLLLHLIDLSCDSQVDILKDYRMLRLEMAQYSPELMVKPHIALFSKMDLYDPKLRDLAALRSALEKEGVTSLPISAETGEGLDVLVDIIFKRYPDLRRIDEIHRSAFSSSEEAQIERREF